MQVGAATLARSRALEGIPFDIELEDIVVPERCPLLGIPLVRGGRRKNRGNPSIDRIDPAKGYVKGNVWVVSTRANKLKNDATLTELETLAANLRRKLYSSAAAANGSVSGSSSAPGSTSSSGT